MSETIIIDAESYRIMEERDLHESDRVLAMAPPKWSHLECTHQNTELVFFLLPIVNKREKTYTPPQVVASKYGRTRICLDCWSIYCKAADQWEHGLLVPARNASTDGCSGHER